MTLIKNPRHPVTDRSRIVDTMMRLQDTRSHIQPAVRAETADSTTTADGLTVASGKTLTVSNSLSLAGTDGEGLTLTGSLAVGADTTISGGGTLALAGHTATLSANGTVALVETSPIVLDRDVSAATVVNSAAQTSVYSYSVPGGTLGTSNKLRLTVQASFLNNTATAGSPRPRVKYGTTTIYDNVIPSAAVSANRHALTIICELAAVGATNTQTAHGVTVVGGAAASAGVSTGNATLQSAVHESVAEDSTLAKTLEVTIQLAAADPLFSCTIDNVFLELLRS